MWASRLGLPRGEVRRDALLTMQASRLGLLRGEVRRDALLTTQGDTLTLVPDLQIKTLLAYSATLWILTPSWLLRF